MADCMSYDADAALRAEMDALIESWRCEDCGHLTLYRERQTTRKFGRMLCSQCQDKQRTENHRRWGWHVYGEFCNFCSKAMRIEAKIECSRARSKWTLCSSCIKAWKTGGEIAILRRARIVERRQKLAELRRHSAPLRHAAGSRYAGPPRMGYVYRIRDAEGALLYVGKTYSVKARLYTGTSSHSTTKEWWPTATSVDVTAYATEAAALDAESWAIYRENPRYNIDRPLPKTDQPPTAIHRYSGALT